MTILYSTKFPINRIDPYQTHGPRMIVAEGLAEMAKSLKRSGVSLEIIAEASGLTKEQINEL